MLSYSGIKLFPATAKIIITADEAPFGQSHISLKKKIDDALIGTSSIQQVLVAHRTGEKVHMEKNRDMYLEEVCTFYTCMNICSNLLRTSIIL